MDIDLAILGAAIVIWTGFLVWVVYYKIHLDKDLDSTDDCCFVKPEEDSNKESVYYDDEKKYSGLTEED